MMVNNRGLALNQLAFIMIRRYLRLGVYHVGYALLSGCILPRFISIQLLMRV